MKAHKLMQPMLLLIDIGNTRLKWLSCPAKQGDFEEELRYSAEVTWIEMGPGGKKTETHEKFPEASGEMETAKVTAARIRKLAQTYPYHRVVLCSVVPKLVAHFRQAFRGRLHLVTADSPALGVSFFNYPKPAELGTDRLAAAAAVREEGVAPAIIVQCGTATAFSVLDAKGRFCGGVIAPGPHAQLAALVGATAQLPMTPLKMSTRVPARSTTDAINSGVMLNFLGGVKEILAELTEYFPERPPRIILTGGNAYMLESRIDFPHTLRPLLVFEGLRIIGLRAFKDV